MRGGVHQNLVRPDVKHPAGPHGVQLALDAAYLLPELRQSPTGGR
jgi:hypothetical protein